MAAATASNGASSPFGGFTTEAFLGVPGAKGLIVGPWTGIALGGGGLDGTTSGVRAGGTLGTGGNSGAGSGAVLGAVWAGRDGAPS
nr:hypothetical protein [Mycobacterium sp. 1164966.3]